jgi:hypothetical protein
MIPPRRMHNRSLEPLHPLELDLARQRNGSNRRDKDGRVSHKVNPRMQIAEADGPFVVVGEPFCACAFDGCDDVSAEVKFVYCVFNVCLLLGK